MRAAPAKDTYSAAGERAWRADVSWLTAHLAVGGCFPIEQAAHLAQAYRIDAIIDLREEDCDDEAALRQAGLAFLHLPTPDLQPSTVPMLDRGVRFARGHLDRGKRVLIHCQHGIGRSALLALCVMVDQGFEPLEAIAHAKDRRERVSPSPSQFEGWCAWLRAHGHQPPDMHSFGCIAYRHLAKG